MANILGDRIKTARKQAGLTQGELAKKLGIAYPTLNKYERGHRVPDSSILSHISGILKCNPGWLLTGDGNDTEAQTVQTTRTLVLKKVPDEFPEQVSEESCEYISLPDVPDDTYAVIVKGDSMTPAIREGDYAIFTDNDNINSGDIVIINNEWGESMLKRFHVKDDKTYLISDNPEYPPLPPDAPYKIIGKVIAIWRKIKVS